MLQSVLCCSLLAGLSSAVVVLTSVNGGSGEVRDVNIATLVAALACLASCLVLPKFVGKNSFLVHFVETAVGVALVALGVLGVIAARDAQRLGGSDAVVGVAYTSAALALVCGLANVSGHMNKLVGQ